MFEVKVKRQVKIGDLQGCGDIERFGGSERVIFTKGQEGTVTSGPYEMNDESFYYVRPNDMQHASYLLPKEWVQIIWYVFVFVEKGSERRLAASKHDHAVDAIRKAEGSGGSAWNEVVKQPEGKVVWTDKGKKEEVEDTTGGYIYIKHDMELGLELEMHESREAAEQALIEAMQRQVGEYLEPKEIEDVLRLAHMATGCYMLSQGPDGYDLRFFLRKQEVEDSV